MLLVEVGGGLRAKRARIFLGLGDNGVGTLWRKGVVSKETRGNEGARARLYRPPFSCFLQGKYELSWFSFPSHPPPFLLISIGRAPTVPACALAGRLRRPLPLLAPPLGPCGAGPPPRYGELRENASDRSPPTYPSPDIAPVGISLLSAAAVSGCHLITVHQFFAVPPLSNGPKSALRRDTINRRNLRPRPPRNRDGLGSGPSPVCGPRTRRTDSLAIAPRDHLQRPRVGHLSDQALRPSLHASRSVASSGILEPKSSTRESPFTGTVSIRHRLR